MQSQRGVGAPRSWGEAEETYLEVVASYLNHDWDDHGLPAMFFADPTSHGASNYLGELMRPINSTGNRSGQGFFNHAFDFVE